MKCLAGHPLGVGTVSDAGGSRSLLQHGDHDSEIHDVQKLETTATKTGRDHPVRPTERPSRGLPTGGGRCVRDSGRNCRPSPRRERLPAERRVAVQAPPWGHQTCEAGASASAPVSEHGGVLPPAPTRKFLEEPGCSAGIPRHPEITLPQDAGLRSVLL